MIRAVSDHPDLAPLVAGWLFEAFHNHPGGMTPEALINLILRPPDGPAECFVMFDDGVPAGTASLAREDLVSRPDLTPWLAGVVVQPEFRFRGHAGSLVRHVEGFARAAGVKRLWLYTTFAEGLYARLGWVRVGFVDGDGLTVLMSRDLAQ